jgi:integrase
MMKIPRVYKSNGRYFYVRDLAERNPNGRPRQKWIPLSRVKDGEAALHTALGKLLDEHKPTANFTATLNLFMAEHFLDLAPDTVKEYRRNYAVIAKAFADFNVDQVTTPVCHQFLADNFAGKPTARQHYKARLSTFFRWCVDKGYCTTNPANFWLKRPPKRSARMDAEKFHAIRDALSPMGKCFLDLCYLTAQRTTEIRLLRWSQIKDGKIKFLPTKTAKSSGATVSVPVTADIQEVFDRAKALGKVQQIGKGDSYIIQSQDGGRFSKTGLISVWKRACAKAGIVGVTAKDIRPFALTMAEKAGYSIEDLRKGAAHTSVATTEGYLARYREVDSPIRLKLPAKK